jgi:hypothetical protein
MPGALAFRTLDLEARALLTRLARVEPFARTLPRVAAAEAPLAATLSIDRHLLGGRLKLRRLVETFLDWLRRDGRRVSPAEAQRRFALVKLRFNAALTQLDIFADALVQRAEHGYGIWLAGLDVVAADALALPGAPYEPPPIITYLDRGHGAAIRRARTRLPGGGKSPVAIIRIPRERMVGSGIASSLIHEVGHQGAALLDLVNSLRAELQVQTRRAPESERVAWRLFERWISEIVADFWAVATVGVAATQGLIGVVSLPRAFVFRIALDDPHPFPWIRVKLSIAFGDLLFPDSQWSALGRVWESFYPRAGLAASQLELIAKLEATLPRFVELVALHRPAPLGGRPLRALFPLTARQPWRLRRFFRTLRNDPRRLFQVAPSLAFAVLGQAKQDGQLDPDAEGAVTAKLLDHFALMKALDKDHGRRPDRNAGARAA